MNLYPSLRSPPSVIRICFAIGDHQKYINGDWSLVEDSSPSCYQRVDNQASATLKYNPSKLCWYIYTSSINASEPIARLPCLANYLIGRDTRSQYKWSILLGAFNDEKGFIRQLEMSIQILKGDDFQASPLVFSTQITSVSSNQHPSSFAITGAIGKHSMILNGFWRVSEVEANDCPVYESECRQFCIDYSSNNGQWLLHNINDRTYDVFALAVLPSRPMMPIGKVNIKQPWFTIDARQTMFEVQTNVQILTGEACIAWRKRIEDDAALQVSRETEAQANKPTNLLVTGVTGTQAKIVNGVFVPSQHDEFRYWKNNKTIGNGAICIEYVPKDQQWQWREESTSQEPVTAAFIPAPGGAASFKDVRQKLKIVSAPLSLHRLPADSLRIREGTIFQSQDGMRIEHGDHIQVQATTSDNCCSMFELICAPINFVCAPFIYCYDAVERFEKRHPCCCLGIECVLDLSKW